MKFGVHLSIAGGLSMALERATQLGCDTTQFFLINPRGWKTTPLTEDAIKNFLTARETTAINVRPLIAHMPYLPNLASFNPEIYRKSVESLRDHLKRCQALKIDYLVLHIGKGNEPDRLQRIQTGILNAYEEMSYSVCLLLENTAGQGREIGYHLAELSELYTMLPQTISKGICLDTCHAFAAGYDLSIKSEIAKFLKEFDKTIGLSELKLIHLNDSLKPLGSKVDRHAQIGKGYIGIDGFQGFFSFREIRRVPCIMEIPRNDIKEDIEQLKLVRSLSSEVRK